MDGAVRPNLSLPETTTRNTQCPLCPEPRLFKGKRGLNIHLAKFHTHSQPSPNAAPPLSAPSDAPPQSLSHPPHPFWQKISYLKNSTPVIKRIPRGARIAVAHKLSGELKDVILQNSSQSWENLLTFPYRVLHIKQNVPRTTTLTNIIKQNCIQPGNFTLPHHPNACRTNSKSLFHLIESKISDGDIKGASRLLFSEDSMAPNSPDTLSALHTKHPPPAADSTLPEPPSDVNALNVTAPEVLGAVGSFRSGTAAGLDGLTAQHLKDLLGCGEAGDSLLKELTALMNLMLAGKVNGDIVPILYGANLCALNKKDGGVRPIAVGTTYRRLAAKLCCRSTADTLRNLFEPIQLGFGVRGGCEAAIHSLRGFLANNPQDVLLKVDVKNAFNSVDRGVLLGEIKRVVPSLYSFLWQCYSAPTKLLYGENPLSSAVGCQQGDPLGPAIFSLAIHPIISKLKSKFNIWYLDDGTLGGAVTEVLEDLSVLSEQFKLSGLELNFSKCELFLPPNLDEKQAIIDKFNFLAPNIKIVNETSLRLLGSPILDESFSAFVEDKIKHFHAVSERLIQINNHMAYTIIRHCVFIPQITYSLRSSHFWNHPHLTSKLDCLIRETVSNCLNINLEGRTWTQASLPIRHGGLGIRQISSISLPAFLSSAHSTLDLSTRILSRSVQNFTPPLLAEAINVWKSSTSADLPHNRSSQRQWDEPLCKVVRNNLIDAPISSADRARLLAVAEWESGLWLRAIPSTNLGTLLDNISFRIAVSLRLGAYCTVPHRCPCGNVVDQLGHHGLSCGRSAGRIPRHASLNDIIRRALASARIPAVLEPNGLSRSDGRRPDGMTLVPWKSGRPLVWDATCVDTLAASHLPSTSSKAGSAAASAECLKRRKYAGISDTYMFEPFGVETLGPWGPSAHLLFRELTKRLLESSRDQKAGLYLGQRISLAIQRGNVTSILGTFPMDSDLGQIFYL